MTASPVARRVIGAAAAAVVAAASLVACTTTHHHAPAGSATTAAPAVTTAPAATAAPGGRDFFPVPAAALVRPLGAVAAVGCPAQASQECAGATTGGDITKGDYPMDVAGLGVPVGGVGAGSFMVNQAGTFGPWDFGGSQDSTWEMRVLPQAALHVREQLGSAPATVRTLATAGPSVTGAQGPVPLRSWGSPLPAWNALAPGQGTYAALYPFGWTSYTPFATDVSTRFFSPIVAREDRRTSLPLVYFDVRLANHTNKPDAVSVMFTMPNAPDHVAATPPTVRTGLSSRFDSDPATGVQAVTLSSDDPTDSPDAAHSEWTIAAHPVAGQTVSYTTSWNASGDGSDVYAPFVSSGRLGDAPIDASHSAGAIAVSATLGPGQVTTVPFVLAWDFPQVAYAKDQTVWMRRYTDFYGAAETATNTYVAGSYPFHQGFHIADDGLAGHDAALSAVESWWRPIAEDTSYPVVLRTAALNQLYQLVFNNSFWEGGLVSNTQPPTGGQRLGTATAGTHLFSTADSTAALTGDSSAGLNNSNEMDVDSYGYLAYDLLFPGLERDRLRARVQATLADPFGDPDGHVDVSGDPFVTWNESKKPTPGVSTFIDVPNKTILRFYAYARLAGDTQFLHAAYPAMQKSLTYLQALITPGNHLPTASKDFANTYDVIPVNGFDVYDSELYLLSLEMVIDAGTRIGSAAGDLAPLRQELAQAKTQFERVFWDPAHGYYRYTPGPAPATDSVMLDTFFAQHLAERFGLPDLVDPTHYRLQLGQSYPTFVGRRDAQGRLLGAPNVVLPADVKTWPLVGPFGPIEETEVWSGTDYFVAATYYAAGRRFADAALQHDGIEMGSAVATQIWSVDGNGFAFDPPEAWHEDTTALYRYPNYARALAIWELMDAIKALPA